MGKVYDVEIEIVEQRGHCPNCHHVGEKFHKNITVFRLRRVERTG